MLSDRPTIVWDLGNVLIPWDRAAALARVTGDAQQARELSRTVFTMELNDILDAGDDLGAVLEQVELLSPGSAPLVRGYVENFAHSLGPADPGCSELLASLVDAGVRCVGLSNFSAITFAGIPERYPVLQLLEGILISGEVGVTKPNQRIYELCEQRFDLLADSVVFIDDNEANTAAAARRGWRTVTFTGARELRTELAGMGLPTGTAQEHRG